MKRGAFLSLFVVFLTLNPVIVQPVGIVSGDIFTGTVPGRSGGLLDTLTLTAFSEQRLPQHSGPNATTSSPSFTGAVKAG